jgi:hypothetical protein
MTGSGRLAMPLEDRRPGLSGPLRPGIRLVRWRQTLVVQPDMGYAPDDD